MRRMLPWLLSAAFAAWAIAPSPAEAAGVGFSLPKLLVLQVGSNGADPSSTSVGGSVQVIGTTFSVGLVPVDVGLDYAYTRDFAHSSNYSFFDLVLGGGLPLAITPMVYIEPAVDAHALFFVAAPQGAYAPALGIAPRLTVGVRPTRAIAVTLGLSEALFPSFSANGRSSGAGMTRLELAGSYSF